MHRDTELRYKAIMLCLANGRKLKLEHIMSYDLPHVVVNMYDLDGDYWMVTQVDKEHPEKTKGLLCISYQHASGVFQDCCEQLRVAKA
jgi:hypothetical protein